MAIPFNRNTNTFLDDHEYPRLFQMITFINVSSFGFSIADVGQRAFVGKVCMDQHAPGYYVEDTAKSVADTETCVFCSLLFCAIYNHNTATNTKSGQMGTYLVSLLIYLHLSIEHAIH